MKNWKKGCLHCHTMWSDGRSLPEIAVKSYLDAGYQFVCLADHNVFQDDPCVWIQVRGEEGPWPPMLSRQEYLRTKELIPGSIIEKPVSCKTYIRLKTFAELKAEWEIPGKFILVPGMEFTGSGESFGIPGRIHAIHCNVFNLPATLPVPSGGTDTEFLGKLLEIYNSAATENSFFMLNHPWYNVWDVDPRLLIQFPEIRFFEICNSGTGAMPENWIYNREQYWDFILAHRIANGDPVLYGTATDDAHFYDPERLSLPGAFGTGFVMVNCPGDLTPENLSNAMKSGDFYSSCGVLLEHVAFSKETGTLKVSVKPERGVQYRIDFITTKSDFDRTVEVAEFPHEKEIFSRTRPKIPAGIGEVAASRSGTAAEYTMAEDDLYVRAIITSDRDSQIRNNFYPEKQCAWTQPFCR